MRVAVWLLRSDPVVLACASSHLSHPFRESSCNPIVQRDQGSIGSSDLVENLLDSRSERGGMIRENEMPRVGERLELGMEVGNVAVPTATR
jgi:hypothetical protein